MQHSCKVFRFFPYLFHVMSRLGLCLNFRVCVLHALLVFAYVSAFAAPWEGEAERRLPPPLTNENGAPKANTHAQTHREGRQIKSKARQKPCRDTLLQFSLELVLP